MTDGSIGGYLYYVNVLLLVSVCLVTVFRSLKLSPVLGYFVSGALIAKVVEPGVGIHIFAEFGIVFLLFVIGLELTLQRLISMRKHVFGFGTLQVVLTALAIGSMFYFAYGAKPSRAFVVGAALAMSSTALVLQVLQETNRHSSPVGRLALSMLILQDLAVVPLLVLVPLLAEGDGTGFATALLTSAGKGALVLCGIMVMGRLLLRPLFRLIVSLASQELFLSTTIFVILSAAYITEKFGLSMALGAFVAGLLIAETEYRDEVEHVVMPFKSLLLGLFFMTVGMSINFDTLISSAREIGSIAATILLCKFAIIFLLCRLFSFKIGSAIQAGLLLSQGGEFAFILLRLASDRGLMTTDLTEKFMMAVTVTMALTPLLAAIGNRVADSMGAPSKSEKEVTAENADMRNHVIIIGFTEFGRTLARVLSMHNIYYAAFDINSATVRDQQKEGYVVYRGDATKPEIYLALAAKHSIAIVVALENKVTAAKTVKLIRSTFPKANVLVSVKDLSMARDLDLRDRSQVYASDLEAAFKISGRIIMENSDTNPEELVMKMHRIRDTEYGALVAAANTEEDEV
jgi:CPA2 family monovalent cation:H+ antiporter-2